mmetsp:Transcript_76670/g.242425  ORF Transcript_76670/g.242425 Transcript_76670/m.242425 type:complete len:241 (+) Transcript_76670:646-1368(+)
MPGPPEVKPAPGRRTGHGLQTLLQGWWLLPEGVLCETRVPAGQGGQLRVVCRGLAEAAARRHGGRLGQRQALALAARPGHAAALPGELLGEGRRRVQGPQHHRRRLEAPALFRRHVGKERLDGAGRHVARQEQGPSATPQQGRGAVRSAVCAAGAQEIEERCWRLLSPSRGAAGHRVVGGGDQHLVLPGRGVQHGAGALPEERGREPLGAEGGGHGGRGGDGRPQSARGRAEARRELRAT